MIADMLRFHACPGRVSGSAPTLSGTTGVVRVGAVQIPFATLAETGTLKNENDRCANTCHLLQSSLCVLSEVLIG